MGVLLNPGTHERLCDIGEEIATLLLLRPLRGPTGGGHGVSVRRGVVDFVEGTDCGLDLV